MIFEKFLGTSPQQKAIARLYEAIVRQARDPAFYLHCGVADSPEGRFDMITLHAVLVMRRLKQGDDEAHQHSQDLFDHMFADVDMNLREMGVGDMGISRRIKKMAAGFFGRLEAYDEALATDDNQMLIAALKRNLDKGGSIPEDKLVRLASYIRQCSTDFAAIELSRLLVGEVDLPSVPGDQK